MPLNLNRRWLALRAHAATLLGRLALAEEAWSGCLALDAHDAHARASRAHLRAQQGRAEAAIEDLQLLVRQHPARSAADWFNLAFLLEQAGRLQEAEPAFREALALDPRLDRAWYGLGLLLISDGRADEAVPALQRATELQPMSPYGWYQLARLHHGAARHEQALKIIRHLRGFEPKVAAQLERETGLSISTP